MISAGDFILYLHMKHILRLIIKQVRMCFKVSGISTGSNTQLAPIQGT
jgi:hypothetical protein